MSVRNILITGATGKQGGSVLRALLTSPNSPQYTLLALTRNTSSSAAEKIKKEYPNVLLVQGDLADTDAVFSNAQKALRGIGRDTVIHGVYSVQVSMGPGVSKDTEVSQGNSLVDVALKNGVHHFIYSSVDRGGNSKSWQNETPIPHFQSKYHIEQYLQTQAGEKGQKMNWTIVRPVAFMDNLSPDFKTKVFLTALRDTLGAKSLQWVSVTDIGAFVAQAFQDPVNWNARAEALAGDDLTFEELSRIFEEFTGQAAPITYGLLGGALKWAVTELRVMLNWFKSDGYGADINDLKSKGVQTTDFRTWLTNSEFNKK